MKKNAVLISVVGAAIVAALLTASPSHARKPADNAMPEMDHHHHGGHEMQAAKTPQQKKAIRLFNKANALCDAGKFEDSLPVYTDAIEQDPQFAEAYFKRGFAFYRLGSNLNALEDLSKAIEINPNYTDAYFYRGVVWSSTGDEEKMIEDLKIAAHLAAVDHTTHVHTLK